jgi:hypothetical protein
MFFLIRDHLKRLEAKIMPKGRVSVFYGDEPSPPKPRPSALCRITYGVQGQQRRWPSRHSRHGDLQITDVEDSWSLREDRV